MNTRLEELTPDTFVAEVLDATTPVLVDFWAPWCGPCRVLTPQVERVAVETGPALKVFTVNVEEHPTLAKTFNVTSLPVLLVFVAGKEVARMHGAAGGYGAIKKLIQPFTETT